MKERTSVLQSLALMCLAVPLSAQPTAQQAKEVDCEGTVGATRIGMTIDFKQDIITGGHYFVARDLQDIPFTSGIVSKGHIAIQMKDRSTFELRFKGNGSENGQPLNFENSAGLVGTRRGHARVEKVNLRFQSMGQYSDGQRYSAFTELRDSEFEGIIRNWRMAVLAGNRRETARYTHFPLRVNAKDGHKMIRNATQLSESWDGIFTPLYLSKIKKDVPHDMRGDKSGLVMLGHGDVWFGDKGVEVLNLPN